MTPKYLLQIARVSIAAFALLTSVLAQDRLLQPHEAFRVSANQGDASNPVRTIAVTYKSAPGYYLYQDRFAFSVEGEGGKITGVVMPKAVIKYEAALGHDVPYYVREVTIQVSLLAGASPLTFVATAQGCASVGICYPPIRKNYLVPAAPRSSRG